MTCLGPALCIAKAITLVPSDTPSDGSAFTQTEHERASPTPTLAVAHCFRALRHSSRCIHSRVNTCARSVGTSDAWHFICCKSNDTHDPPSTHPLYSSFSPKKKFQFQGQLGFRFAQACMNTSRVNTCENAPF